jgi:hypothetical protein
MVLGRLVTVSVALLLVAGVTLRLREAIAIHTWEPTSSWQRQNLLARLPLPQAAAGTDANSDLRGDIRGFRFDPHVPVLLTPGPDRQPGRSGIDDNVDGVIDDRGELGAVGSDDRCLGPTDDGYQQAQNAPQRRVISRGGFVPCVSDCVADRFLVDELGWFLPDRR